MSFGGYVDKSATQRNIILEHELVPKHEIMSKKEVSELLKKHGVTERQLPKIRESDAIAQAIGAKRKDVLKITRKSLTAGEALYYRIVV